MLPLSGCGWLERAERPAWRTEAENLCLAHGLVKPSAYIEPRPAIDGPGICGLTRPFRVTAIADGAIAFDKPLILDCSMIPALEAWIANTVEPAAEARFGAHIVGLGTFGSYSCRSVDDMPGARLSEHAFANAIDVSGFKLSDGREISIVSDWKRTETQESAFLRGAHAGACQTFTTALGPGADVFHYNHFHLDLGIHGSTNSRPRRICRPTPPSELAPPPTHKDGLPPAPDIDEPLDVSRAVSRATPAPPMPRFAGAGPIDLHGLDVAAPPPIGSYAPRPLAPALPSDNDIDSAPTSSIGAAQDD